MKSSRFSKLRVENLEERTLLAVMAGGAETAVRTAMPTEAATWVVNTLEDPASWDTTDDVVSLREAIERAADGDTVTFDETLAGGTITLNGSKLKVYCGITIDASVVGGITIDAEEQSGVFNIIGGDSDNPVELIGLIITGGSAHGIYNTGVLVIVDSTIAGNTSPLGYGGGGIINDGGRISLTACAISDNSSQTIGGGIWNWNGGSVLLLDCTITGNHSGGYMGSAGGGGVYNGWNDSACVMTLINCTVSGNGTSSYGGGILNDSKSDIVITNSVISENRATGGGGVDNSGRMTMSGTIVSENTANVYFGGGISNQRDGIADVSTCVIMANRVASSIYYAGGGGICSFGDLNCINSTIVANSAYAGGGIFLSSYYTNISSDTTLINTIVAQNWSENGNEIATISEVSGHNNMIGIDPGFKVAPIFESGTLINFDSLDVSLTSISPAIDCGDNSIIITDTDLGGNPRIVNGVVDIGAYEYQGDIHDQLVTPEISTGNRGAYVSCGTNRHQIQWDAIENASAYELQYSADGSNWTTISGTGAATVVTGLTYGHNVQYRVRALGTGYYTDSDWSEIKTFAVCPMDINGDGDVTGVDRTIMMSAWFSEEGDDDYRYCADINGDGDVSGSDLVFLSNNWLCEVGVDDLVYPRPLAAADTVFAEFASAELDVDPDVF